MNVLGVEFDSKLQWSNHIAKAISKSRRALHAIRLIRNYFTQTELKNLITSNFYSILYYNCEVWLIPSLKASLKQQLFSCSSEALKLCGRLDWTISFERLHSLHKRANPMSMMRYKHSLELYKLYNGSDDRQDWIDLNFQQNFNNRNNFINVFENSRLKVGKNLLVNRMTCINGMINHDWMNLSLDSYKVKCKALFLS